MRKLRGPLTVLTLIVALLGIGVVPVSAKAAPARPAAAPSVFLQTPWTDFIANPACTSQVQITIFSNSTGTYGFRVHTNAPNVVIYGPVVTTNVNDGDAILALIYAGLDATDPTCHWFT